MSRFYAELRKDELVFKPSDLTFSRKRSSCDSSSYSYVTGEDHSWSTTMFSYLNLQDDKNQEMKIFSKRSVAGDLGRSGREFREGENCLRLKNNSDFSLIRDFFDQE